MSAAQQDRQRSWADHVAELDARLARVDTRTNEFGYDAFGFSPRFLRRAALPVMALYHYYFRCEIFGAEHIPGGRVLFIANHSGQIPIDGAMIGMAVIHNTEPPRVIRSMIERWVPSLPFVSTFMARCGQILGTPNNCRRLLDADEAILVFPEGAKGISKTFDKRYQLQSFGHGFMRLALESNTPIVPVAVVGAEEQAPALMDLKPLARLLAMPAFPITPTFPLLGPLGFLPLPARYRIYFGAPLHFEGDADEDEVTIEPKVRAVRNTIQSMLHQGTKQRRRVFW